MAGDSEWDVLQVRLTQLLERRTALAAALASLDAAREGDTATAEQFRAKTPLLAEG